MVDTTDDVKAFADALAAQATQYSLARRFGVARLLGGAIMSLQSVPPSLATELVLLQTNPSAIAETTEEGLNRSADDATLRASALGSLPLIVVAAGQNMRRPDWADAQNSMARLSTRGHLVVVEESGHSVHLERPEIVIDAIKQVIAAIRGGP